MRLTPGVVVKIFFELAFYNAALFFDNKNLVFVLDELERPVRFQRPDHADFVNIDADPLCGVGIYVEQAQRFHEVEVSLARSHYAEARIRNIENFSVYRVCSGKRDRRGFLCFQPLLNLWSRKVRPAVVQAIGRHHEVRRNLELGIRGQLYGQRRLDGLGDGLESHPHSRESRQRNSVQAELHVLGDAGGVQVRHHERHERDV